MSKKAREKELKKHTEDQEEEAPPDTVTVSVSFSPSTGQLGLYGPIHNRPMCLYILEMARIQIMSKPLVLEDESQIILPLRPGLVSDA